MTRIWHVPFEELDDQRVLGQHKEWHMIGALLRKGKSWGGWEDPQYYFDFENVHERIVEEMKARGFSHWSPAYLHLPAKPDEDYAQSLFPVTETELERDRWHLVCRWGGKFKGRINTNPSAWDKTLARYREHGCLHDEGVVDKNLCAVCKRAIFDKRSGTWKNRVP